MKLLRFIIFLTLTNCWVGYALPADSIGVETKNGKNYIKHKVESGETLYRISKKYGATVDEIKSENPDIQNGVVKDGMVLFIPSVKSSKAKTSKAKDTPKESPKVDTEKPSKDAKTHTVENGQGLFAISRLYKVSVADLKKWNELSSEDVKVGQVLFVSKPSSEVAKPAEQTSTAPPKSNEDNKSTITKPATTNRTVASATPNAANRKIMDTLKVVAFKKQDGPSEKNYHFGVAVVVPDAGNADKFEAYYDHVPVGSFINVKSLYNEEKVFLKVVGKLPKQSDPKVIIGYTTKALERLQSTDSKLAVEVSYVAP